MEYKPTTAVRVVRYALLIIALSMSIAIAADFSYDSADTASLQAGLPAKASKLLSMFNDLKDYINAVSGEWVDTKHIIDGGVTGPKINSSAMGNGLTKDGSSNVIIDLATYSGMDFSSGALQLQVDDSTVAISTTNEVYVKDSGITTTQILDGTIATADMANLAITADKLASDAVTTVKIYDEAVTLDKMADASVDTDNLVDDSVTVAKVLSMWEGTVGSLADTEYGTGPIRVKLHEGTNAASPGTYNFATYGFDTSYYQNFYICVGAYAGGYDLIQFTLNPFTGTGYVYTSGGTGGGTMLCLIIGVRK